MRALNFSHEPSQSTSIGTCHSPAAKPNQRLSILPQNPQKSQWRKPFHSTSPAQAALSLGCKASRTTSNLSDKTSQRNLNFFSNFWRRTAQCPLHVMRGLATILTSLFSSSTLTCREAGDIDTGHGYPGSTRCGKQGWFLVRRNHSFGRTT